MQVDVHEDLARSFSQEEVLGMVRRAEVRKDLLGTEGVALRFKVRGRAVCVLLFPARLNGEGDLIHGLIGFEKDFNRKMPRQKFVDYC